MVLKISMCCRCVIKRPRDEGLHLSHTDTGRVRSFSLVPRPGLQSGRKQRKTSRHPVPVPCRDLELPLSTWLQSVQHARVYLWLHTVCD